MGPTQKSMAIYNINAGYGQLLAGNLPFRITGKTIVVGKTGVAYRDTYADLFGNDLDGVARYSTTITGALLSCTANAGDMILVLPGHTETIVGAAGVAVNVAGVNIVGLGSGSLRPTFTFTTSIAASFNISAANVSVQNCIFTCGIDAQTAMVNVSAADVSFTGCDFNTNSGTAGAVLGILTAATSDRLVVDTCRFLGPAVNSGTTTTAQIQYESAVDIKIQNSYFTGKMTQSILNVTGTVLRGLIFNNNFVIATGTKAIAVAAASTPFISSNNINVPSGTAPVVAAAGFVAGNRYSAAAGVTAGTAATF